MKPVIAVVCCLVLSFIGMQVYMGLQANDAARPDLANADDAAPEPAPDEDAPPAAEPELPPPPRQNPPVVNPSKAKPPKVQAPPVAKNRASGPMYFTVVGRYANGVPTKVWIRNSPAGDCLILMVNAKRSDGRLYRTKGMTQGKQKHRWEVEVVNGNVSVFWDGQSVAAGR